ncbi:MAG: rod shape-determining protein MreD [Prevotella sp.]|nr:rod shape-determining protein MreD [Candidatus Equicola faecalis]
MEITIKRIGWFLVFFIVQILLLNKIHLFHVATPFLMVYFIMQFPLTYPRTGLLLWSFFMGLLIDISTNIPGVTAASLTIVGFIQPYILNYFAPNDFYEMDTPSVRTMTFQKFFNYAATVIFTFCIIFFSFEAFNLFHFGDWLLRVVFSGALTLIFILALERFKR